MLSHMPLLRVAAWAPIAVSESSPGDVDCSVLIGLLELSNLS